MLTYPLKLVVDGRPVSVLVIGRRKIAFLYADGVSLGRLPIDAAADGEAETAERIRLAGLEVAALRRELDTALRIETEARRALELATLRGAESRKQALDAMRDAAASYATRAAAATGDERELLQRVRDRIAALATRFV